MPGIVCEMLRGNMRDDIEIIGLATPSIFLLAIGETSNKTFTKYSTKHLTQHRHNIKHDQGLRQIFCSLFNKDIKIIEIFMSLNERENVVCFVDFYKINRYRCALIKYL